MFEKEEYHFSTADKNNSAKRDEGQLRKELREIGQSLTDLLDSIAHKMTFPEYIGILSEFIDDKIADCSAKENLSFVAGTCVITVNKSTKKHLNIQVDLYFKDAADNWAKKTLNGTIRIAKFTDEAIKNEITEINKNGKLEIKVDRPN